MHNWCTIGLLVIILVSTSRSSEAKEERKTAKVVSIIKTQLLLPICSTTNNLCLFSYSVCAVLVSGQLLPPPRETVADPRSKYQL